MLDVSTAFALVGLPCLLLQRRERPPLLGWLLAGALTLLGHEDFRLVQQDKTRRFAYSRLSLFAGMTAISVSAWQIARRVSSRSDGTVESRSQASRCSPPTSSKWAD